MELTQRRRDLFLKREVLNNLTPHGRIFVKKLTRICGVVFRQVASPTNDVERFLTMTSHLGLHPIILEYYGDKFVSAGNMYKRSLGKMPIYNHTGTDGRDIVHYKTIVDFNSYVGKPLSSVMCRNGASLIEFHHSLLQKMTRFDVSGQCIDATEWFQSAGVRASNYYEQFLSLFIRDAILFEYFTPTKAERKFVQEVFIPSYKKVEARYNLKPLIIELVPKNKAGRLFWDSYPTEIKEFF